MWVLMPRAYWRLKLFQVCSTFAAFVFGLSRCMNQLPSLVAEKIRKICQAWGGSQRHIQIFCAAKRSRSHGFKAVNMRPDKTIFRFIYNSLECSSFSKFRCKKHVIFKYINVLESSVKYSSLLNRSKRYISKFN